MPFPSGRSGLAHLAALTFLALFLSGCTVRAWVSVDVAADESGTFEVTMAFDQELRAVIESESPEPIDWTDLDAVSGPFVSN
jgi:PBP1b-binding outer membrane lipoprotein LpoB